MVSQRNWIVKENGNGEGKYKICLKKIQKI